jgi:hypothetical protein
MGHADIRTTEAYLHVMDKSLADVTSPLDQTVDKASTNTIDGIHQLNT